MHLPGKPACPRPPRREPPLSEKRSVSKGVRALGPAGLMGCEFWTSCPSQPAGCPCLPSGVSLFSQASLQHVFTDFRCSPDFLCHICCFLMTIVSTRSPSDRELLGPSSTRLPFWRAEADGAPRGCPTHSHDCVTQDQGCEG